MGLCGMTIASSNTNGPEFKRNWAGSTRKNEVLVQSRLNDNQNMHTNATANSVGSLENC